MTSSPRPLSSSPRPLSSSPRRRGSSLTGKVVAPVTVLFDCLDSRFRGNDGKNNGNDGKGGSSPHLSCHARAPSRHPRVGGDPVLLLGCSRLYCNARALSRHPRAGGDPGPPATCFRTSADSPPLSSSPRRRGSSPLVGPQRMSPYIFMLSGFPLPRE